MSNFFHSCEGIISISYFIIFTCNLCEENDGLAILAGTNVKSSLKLYFTGISTDNEF